VYGKKIQVKYQKDPEVDGNKVDGYFDASKFLIVVDSSLSKEQQQITLYHECIHALMYRCGLHAILDPGMEELVCETVSQFMFDVLKYKKL
jgi:hypothetical protein